MAEIAVFIERYTVSSSEEMGALMRFGQAAQKLGHRLDVLFRSDMYKIPEYDALFIRALTDPLNSSYVAARTAQLHGLRVVDDPDSIFICCDKVNMYRHLQKAGVPMPETRFLTEADLTLERAEMLFQEMGSPVVLKAPNSSFSMYVERVNTPKDFVKTGKRFLRRADRIVVQTFVRSEFDWRVGVLAGKALYVCQYLIPKRRWKVLTYTESGRVIDGDVKGYELKKVDPKLLETAVQAAKAIGKGLYGVDLKQVGHEYTVIEVNDNPTIAEGEEDDRAPKIYEQIIRYLAGEWGDS
ncbi:RimK family alpha-L-glutamate ligase [Candidatus Acetothermia bacterium]|nr:RimK family alpha-L-glutamate ligase [Candidatus Acetothermia bacterium]MBI3644207.1 RimK family alpha-L-glutamate ligase [Candidatus Acetothermia bacterium]